MLLTQEEQALVQVGLAHAILRSVEAPKQDDGRLSPRAIAETMCLWRTSHSSLRDLDLLTELPIMASPVLKQRLFDVVRPLAPEKLATWIKVRGWDALQTENLELCLDVFVLAARVHRAPVLCGLFSLASRLALELVDPPDNASLCRMTANAKTVLDTFRIVLLDFVLSATRHRADDVRLVPASRYASQVALAEMLARLIHDFDHVPLAHTYLLVLAEQALSLLSKAPSTPTSAR